MFLPGGAMGKGLANMGIIGSESGYAMGIGAARAAARKGDFSSASSLMSSVGGARALGEGASTPIPQGYNFNSMMTSQYNALTPNARRMFREEMRRTNPHRLQAFDSYYRGLSGGSMGNAGGGVTGGAFGPDIIRP